MKKYLKLELGDDFFYSPKKLRLSFKNLNTLNDTLFFDLLKGFLNALLYFNSSVINTTTGEFDLNDNIKNKVSTKIITYKIFEIDSYSYI